MRSILLEEQETTNISKNKSKSRKKLTHQPAISICLQFRLVHYTIIKNKNEKDVLN